MEAEAEKGVHEIILASDGIEVPEDIPALFPGGNLPETKERHLFRVVLGG
jgi:hypothetical protein